jgi:hypothetical protein
MDKSISRKKLRRAKKLSLVKARKDKRIRVASSSDIPMIAKLMANVWAKENIEQDLHNHFSRQNISVVIEEDDETRAILLITILSKKRASITALYSSSFRYLKELYKLFCEYKESLDEYRFVYISKEDIFQNHTQKIGGVKWVVL